MNMHIIRGKLNIPFIPKQRIFLTISLVGLLVSVASLVLHGGPRWGLDFTGGALIELRFPEAGMKMADLRQQVTELGYPDAEILSSTTSSRDQIYSVKVKREQGAQTEEELEALKEKFTQKFGEKTIDRAETVGPKVGGELRRKGWTAFLLANVGILLYVAFRFEFKYALGAVLAHVHDVVLTVGLFSLLNKEISLEIVAALLTIVGYSVNDTIVVFDRVRENLKKYRKLSLREVINLSVNETLSRTVLTSLVTFYSVLALLILSGGVVREFAFAMCFGIVSGTYSSIFIASPIVIFWEEKIASRFGRKKR